MQTFKGLITCFTILSVLSITTTPSYAQTQTQTQPQAQTQSQTPVQTPAQDQKSFVKNLGDLGVTFNRSGANLDVVVDQAKVIATIPKFQQLGFLNPKITQTTIDTKPTEIAFFISTLFTSMLIHDYYTNDKTLDKLHIKGYIIPTKGKTNKQMCYSLDFNRSIFNKINWDVFKESDLIKMAPNFSFTKWCHDLLSKEMK